MCITDISVFADEHEKCKVFLVLGEGVKILKSWLAWLVRITSVYSHYMGFVGSSKVEELSRCWY